MKLNQMKKEVAATQISPKPCSLEEQAIQLKGKANRSFAEDLELVAIHNQIQEMSKL